MTKDTTVLRIVHVLNNKHHKVTTSMFVENRKLVEQNVLNTPSMNTNLEETVMVVHHHSTGTHHTQITFETNNIPSTIETTYKIISFPTP